MEAFWFQVVSDNVKSDPTDTSGDQAPFIWTVYKIVFLNLSLVLMLLVVTRVVKFNLKKQVRVN